MATSGQSLGRAIEVHRPTSVVVVDNVFILDIAQSRHIRISGVEGYIEVGGVDKLEAIDISSAR